MKIQGEYEIQNHIYYEFDRSDRIGEGGMGVVYRGRMVDEHTGAFREVAIKEVQTGGDPESTREIVEQAYREASIQLRNDNLVEMMGYVELEDRRLGFVKKRLYVVSEFLSGVTLDHILEGRYTDYRSEEIHYAKDLAERLKKNPEQTAAYIIKHVLSAIVAMHDAGYLHRDIDPSNIMVTADGKIKLIDYGIATRLEELNKGADTPTDEGSFVGKVEYAAPELISGRVSVQDYTTDIYSIGVLFYRLLTGHLPFEGNRFDIMKGQLEKKPNVSAIHSRKCRAIVEKALEKQQAKRFASASAMRAALDGPEPAPKWVPYVGAGAGVVAIVALAILLGRKSGGNGELRKEVVNIDKYTRVEKIWNKDKLLSEDTIRIEKPKPVVEEEPQTRAVEDVSATLACSAPELWAQLQSRPGSPAVLYALSLIYEKQAADKAAKTFWESTVKGQQAGAAYLKEYGTISSRRLAYVLACMSLDALQEQDVDWIPEQFPSLVKTRVQELYPTAKNFILPAAANE
ncbi:MAG: serine/threonine-protein kinase [Candidatus Cryptobacteroides sp.]|nr:serine/threonine-protein kinase [Candidatus Cryptobacteroides sp.]